MVIDHNYCHLKLSTVNSKTTVTHIKFAKTKQKLTQKNLGLKQPLIHFMHSL